MNRKTIFDVVRVVLRRGFSNAEAETIDRAIGEALEEQHSEPPAPAGRVGEAGLTLIKRFEGCARRREDGLIEAYPDPATGGEPWTIGWGSTRLEGRTVRKGDCISQEQADALFSAQLERYADEVLKALNGAPASPAQFDALVSFHYNTGAIARATLTAKHRAGDHQGAAAEFARWNRAGGRVMKGLVRRREAEAALYRSGC